MCVYWCLFDASLSSVCCVRLFSYHVLQLVNIVSTLWPLLPLIVQSHRHWAFIIGVAIYIRDFDKAFGTQNMSVTALSASIWLPSVSSPVHACRLHSALLQLLLTPVVALLIGCIAVTSSERVWAYHRFYPCDAAREHSTRQRCRATGFLLRLVRPVTPRRCLCDFLQRLAPMLVRSCHLGLLSYAVYICYCGPSDYHRYHRFCSHSTSGFPSILGCSIAPFLQWNQWETLGLILTFPSQDSPQWLSFWTNYHNIFKIHEFF